MAHTRRLEALARHLSGPAPGEGEGLEACPTAGTSYSSIKVERAGAVAVITIARPKALNALNKEVMTELTSAALALDRDPSVRVMVITGDGPKSFVAGADIKEMAEQSYAQAYNGKLLAGWDALRAVRKPLIAAVNGFALGGGCELAMMCDVIIASDNASFGQPEITLGIVPGMGGTQRLTRAVGKSRAMEMILTGNRVTAAKAAAMGLVSRVVPAQALLPEALEIANKIAEHSVPVVAKAKECVNVAYEGTLAEGLRFEQREFWSCFALDDQKEGMAAFSQKRKPTFKDV